MSNHFQVLVCVPEPEKITDSESLQTKIDYQLKHFKSRTFSKCRSRLTNVRLYWRAIAAIHTSFCGMGVPFLPSSAAILP